MNKAPCVFCEIRPASRRYAAPDNGSDPHPAFCSQRCAVKYALTFLDGMHSWCHKHETWGDSDGYCDNCEFGV